MAYLKDTINSLLSDWNIFFYNMPAANDNALPKDLRVRIMTGSRSDPTQSAFYNIYYHLY